jgi:2-polyprenyl-6-methoxyphenol hydroxylase-like FAD-dependent oxidoreductase
VPAGFEGFPNHLPEVIVVGAGVAGTTAAALLGAQRRRVILVDARQNCPPVFKAEKIESDQAELLERFDLLQGLLPQAGRIQEIRSYYNGRHFRTTVARQYGLSYSDIVNLLRECLDETVQFKVARVTRIENSSELQFVTLDNGERLATRLVVLACGLNGELPSDLGLKRVIIRKNHSEAVAFTLAKPNGTPFEFDAATCFPPSQKAGVDYLSLFRIGETMRANLFAFPAADESWARRLLQDPERELEVCFPYFRLAVGGYQIVRKIETSLIHLYRTEGNPLHGVALIGDAAANACPATGMGLSKVLTDVDVLCSECAPRWLETPGMSVDKLADYYNDLRKRAVDEKALHDADYRRRARTDRSLRWKIHRARLGFEMRFEKPTKAGANVTTEREYQM